MHKNTTTRDYSPGLESRPRRVKVAEHELGLRFKCTPFSFVCFRRVVKELFDCAWHCTWDTQPAWLWCLDSAVVTINRLMPDPVLAFLLTGTYFSLVPRQKKVLKTRTPVTPVANLQWKNNYLSCLFFNLPPPSK